MRVRETRISTASIRGPTALLALLVGVSLATPADLAFGQICPPLITDPAPLNTTAGSDSAVDIQPQIATDGAGTWIVAWSSTESLGGTIGTDKDILFARSTDNGETWTDPQPLNTNAAVDIGTDGPPHIIIDSASLWLAVWASNDSLGGTIDGDFDILFARSTNGGQNWSDPAPLNTNAASDAGLDVGARAATDGSGNWLVVWQSWEDFDGELGYDNDILFARSTDNGTTWSAPRPLNTTADSDSPSTDDEQPDLATDGAGNWVVVWHAGQWGGPPTDFDILFARSTDNGVSWTDPAPLNTNAGSDLGSDRSPQLVTDGAGAWVAVWQSVDDLGGTIGGDLDILFAHSANNGITWSDPEPLNTDAPFDEFIDGFPQISTDREGTWVAVWDASLLGGFPPDDGDIFFSMSRDGGETWADRARLNNNGVFDSGEDGRARPATDGSGNWITVWDSDEELQGTIGTDRDILLARFQTGNSAPVMICHFPPGNHSNRHTLIVPQSAVPAHLAHGDHCGGPCGAPHPPASDLGRHEAPDCPPDLDSDGSVAPADLALLLGSWGTCPDCANCPADLDGDCTVGPLDLAILLGNWG